MQVIRTAQTKLEKSALADLSTGVADQVRMLGSGGPSKDVREGPEVGERDALNLNTQSNKKG